MAKLINDVSFSGSRIIISGPAGSVDVVDFMDDANPVEFQECEVSGVGVNCYGQMIRYAKPSAIIMSVTVIPGSKSDNDLWDMWLKFRIKKDYDLAWDSELQAQVDIHNGTYMPSRSLSGGTMVSGPGGPTSNGEGKMQGRTYTFAFVEPT